MLGKVLIIENDKSIRNLLKVTFGREQFECFETAFGASAIEIIREHLPQIIILDLHLEGLTNGWDILELLKNDKKTTSIPIIVITGIYKDAGDIEKIFEMGADDFLFKPFSPTELLLRAKAILRRTGSIAKKKHLLKSKNAAITIDVQKGLVKFKSAKENSQTIEVDLTPKEYELLQLFLKYPNQFFTRDSLSIIAWGEEFFLTPDAVDKNVKSLQSKIPPLCGKIKMEMELCYKFKDM